MDIILLEDLEGLGAKGSLVHVKPGYARNYLLPLRLAIAAGDKAGNLYQELERQRLAQADKRLVQARAEAAKLDGVEINIAAEANEEDTLFGSVTSADVAAALAKAGHDVDKRRIELPEQVRANYSTPDGRRQLLDRAIEEKVWLQAATKKGVPDRPQVKRQIEQQRRDFLIRTYVGEVMAQNPAPTDSEARVYYDAHADDYKMPATITLRHIQTKTRDDARRVLTWTKGKM